MDDDNIHEQLKLAFSIYVRESEKFEAGVKSSAVRARQALQEIKELSSHRRKEIQDKKQEM
jgi:hypothetical protein